MFIVLLHTQNDANSLWAVTEFLLSQVFVLYTGPSTPQNTGLMCLQSYSADQKGFRVCATGVILQQDKSIAVMKKLKLIGYPYKVHRKTAFIKVSDNNVVCFWSQSTTENDKIIVVVGCDCGGNNCEKVFWLQWSDTNESCVYLVCSLGQALCVLGGWGGR